MSARPYEREVRVAACADYLLNTPLKLIKERHGVAAGSTVVAWVRRTGHFKLYGMGRRVTPIARNR